MVHIRQTLALLLDLVAFFVDPDHPLRRRLGGGKHDPVGTQRCGEVCLQGVAQLFTLGGAVTIDLVQHQQQRTALCGQRAQRREFGPGEVAVDHEQDQVGTPGHLPGQLLACLAVDLIDPGGIDQVDVAVVKLAPLATLDGPGLAVKRAGAEALLTQQGVDQR